MVRSTWIGTAVLLATVAAAGCSERDTADVVSPDAPALSSSGPVLIECPSAETTATTGRIFARGGTIRLHGHALSVPAHALTSPQEFSLADPASNYMELAAKASGFDSFSFRKASVITIDYSRCTRDNIDHYPLSVWQIDPETKELIEYMGGVDDKLTRTVTFYTDHLSTFSIAR